MLLHLNRYKQSALTAITRLHDDNTTIANSGVTRRGQATATKPEKGRDKLFRWSNLLKRTTNNIRRWSANAQINK